MDPAPDALAPLLEESSRNERAALDRLIDAAWRLVSEAIDGDPAGGSGRAAPERARLLEAALAAGDRERASRLAASLVASQRGDGSFAADAASPGADLVTPTCGISLVAAARSLDVPGVVDAVRRAAELVLASRPPDATSRTGGGELLATALAAGFLCRAGGIDSLRQPPGAARAREVTLQAVHECAPQGGLWRDGAASDADSLRLTAEVLLHALVPALVAARGDDAPAAAACARSVRALAAAQSASGAWPGGGAALAVACTRAGLEAGTVLLGRDPGALDGVPGGRHLAFVERGFAWVLAAMGDRGWGEAPGAVATAGRTAEAVVLLAGMRARRASVLGAAIAAREGAP